MIYRVEVPIENGTVTLLVDGENNIVCVDPDTCDDQLCKSVYHAMPWTTAVPR